MSKPTFITVIDINTDNGNIVDLVVRNTVTLVGGMSDECYFDEVANEISSDDLPEEVHSLEDGFYRLVLSVDYESYVYTTYEGQEYDYDLDISVLNCYGYSDVEVGILMEEWNGSTEAV